MEPDEDQRLSDVVAREASRLGAFIRRRVPDPRDAEDILQDVFFELVEANRLLMPIEHVTAWLFRVARNRITDFFRRKRPERLDDVLGGQDEESRLAWEELLPSPDDGPAALHERAMLIDAIELALEELPPEQRQVFVAHELEGARFREMAEAAGVSVNTLLARKRYAVRHLRKRLRAAYDDLTKARNGT